MVLFGGWMFCEELERFYQTTDFVLRCFFVGDDEDLDEVAWKSIMKSGKIFFISSSVCKRWMRSIIFSTRLHFKKLVDMN